MGFQERELTLCPSIDGVLGGVFGGVVQVLPEDIEFVLQISKEYVGVAAGSPGIAAHARVAIIPIEAFFLGPCGLAVRPIDR